MKCPNCGETYIQKRNFCVLCGADLHAQAEEPGQRATVEEHPVPTAPKKPVTAEDFFGPARVVRRDTRMNDLSVSDIDLRQLADAKLQQPEHRRYMKSASDCGIDMTNTVTERRASTVEMGATAPDETRTLKEHVRTASSVRMTEASGCDNSNLATSSSSEKVSMSDDVRCVEAMPSPRRKPVDEIDEIPLPGFILQRRKAAVSLEIPNL